MKKERIEYVAIKFYFLDWEGKESYSETVHVNRKTGKIRWKWIIDGYEIHGTYSAPQKIRQLLCDFSPSDFLSHVPGYWCTEETETESRRYYKIEIKFKNSPTQTLEGNFNRNGLPVDYGIFA